MGTRMRQSPTAAITAALIAVTLLTACGAMRDSRLNPMNWFGRSQEVQQTTTTTVASDPRALVQTVLSMNVDSYPGGAIVRATGLPPTQGWWEAELVERPTEDASVLVFDFRVYAPPTRQPVVNQQSREITVAVNLSNIKLDGIREIIIQGESNARSSRR